jgi:enoyl-CoA hydratase/carnithine racemase
MNTGDNGDTSNNDVIQVSRPAEFAGVAVVTLNAPQRRNALGREARIALASQLHHLMVAEPSVRAIVLTGAQGHFCAGADIGEFKPNTMLQGRRNLELGFELVGDLAGGPKPVVAAIEGVAFGMGLSLAVACDFVVAARTARFCAAFIRVGLLPDTGILWTLPKRVGMARARELLSLATELDGTEAARIGLANRLTAPGEALQEALGLAVELAAKPPLGMACLKTALSYRAQSLQDSLRAELDYQPLLRQTADSQEAARAFLEKRAPHFQGR